MPSKIPPPLVKFFNLACTGCVLVLSVGLLIAPAPDRNTILKCANSLNQMFETTVFNWIAPFLKIAIRYEVPAQNLSVCSDKQSVTIDASIRYYGMPKDMTELCDQTNSEYCKITIIPAAKNVISKTISSYSAPSLYSSSCGSVQDKITFQLRKDLSKYNIGLEGVTVRRINFTGTFANEIKRKQLALLKSKGSEQGTDHEKAERLRIYNVPLTASASRH